MQIVDDIQHIMRQAQQSAYRSINQAMVQAYWLVGKRIVEEEQQGESKAAYGKSIIKNLSAALQAEFGKGFSERNIENMRALYVHFPIPQTLSAELETPDFRLSWSHLAHFCARFSQYRVVSHRRCASPANNNLPQMRDNE